MYVALKTANNSLIKSKMIQNNTIINKTLNLNLETELKIAYENKIKTKLEKISDLQKSRLWFHTIVQAVRSNSLHIVLTLLKNSHENWLFFMERLITSGICLLKFIYMHMLLYKI
jgi:hypothetical protein